MMMAILILGLKALQDAVAQITFVDIYNQFDDTVIKKIHSNPLKRSFQVLGDILLQDSQESYERESRKAKQDKATKQSKTKQTCDGQKPDDCETKHFSANTIRNSSWYLRSSWTQHVSHHCYAGETQSI